MTIEAVTSAFGPTASFRQQEIARSLGAIIATEGFEHLTVAVLVDRLRCSRRTLYTLATTRDELILRVVQELLGAWLQEARAAAESTNSPLEGLIAYLSAGFGHECASDQFTAEASAHPDLAAAYARYMQARQSDLDRLARRALTNRGRRTVGLTSGVAVRTLSAVARDLERQLADGTLEPDAARSVLSDLAERWLGPQSLQ